MSVVSKHPLTDILRLDVPPGPNERYRCLLRAERVIEEDWGHLENFACTIDELFAVWWHHFGDETEKPGKNEQMFDIFRRGRLNRLDALIAHNRTLSYQRRRIFHVSAITNIREILGLRDHRLTRTRIEDAKRLYETHPPDGSKAEHGGC